MVEIGPKYRLYSARVRESKFSMGLSGFTYLEVRRRYDKMMHKRTKSKAPDDAIVRAHGGVLLQEIRRVICGGAG